MARTVTMIIRLSASSQCPLRFQKQAKCELTECAKPGSRWISSIAHGASASSSALASLRSRALPLASKHEDSPRDSSTSLEREMSRSESHPGSFLKYAAYLHLAPGKPSPIQSAAFIPGGGFTHSAGKCTMSTSLTILASASHLVRPAAFDCIA